jgi:hypothetical protein
MIKQLFIFLSHVLHFESFKNVMGVLPQASEVIFEVQMKWNNEKVKRRKISFSTYKTHFILFFFFGPLLFSNLIIFLFLIHFK